eukprot:scaffold7269_cov63-Phaeocystis_antarctica.AAC.3
MPSSRSSTFVTRAATKSVAARYLSGFALRLSCISLRFPPKDADEVFRRNCCLLLLPALGSAAAFTLAFASKMNSRRSARRAAQKRSRLSTFGNGAATRCRLEQDILKTFV